MGQAQVSLQNGDSILFIGNSKVGSEGGLHHHFRRTLKTAEKALQVNTHWITMYNHTSLDEMFTEEIKERIKSSPENTLIVQSGRPETLDQVADLIRSNQKQMIIFGTWADNPLHSPGGWSAFREETQKQMQELKEYENKTNIPVAPSGLIFYELLTNPVKYENLREDYLFVPGGSVQNDLGTVVNVATLYCTLTGKSPVGLPVWDTFDPKLIRAIQKRVWNIYRQWKKGKIELSPIPNKKLSKPSMANMTCKEPNWKPVLNNDQHIYYVGNSYIGSEGGLENHFTRILKQINPPVKLFPASDIFWGQGLARMHTDEVQKNILSEKYQVVVVTSGPQEILHQFKEDIDKANARMVIHLTWGRNPTINEGGVRAFRDQTVEIVRNIQEFQDKTGILVVPCGLIFYDLIVDPPKIKGLNLREDWIFMVENIHQNHLGTMANVAAHYAVLSGCSPVGLPMWDPYPAELVREIQERAWKIVNEWMAGKVTIKEIDGSSMSR